MGNSVRLRQLIGVALMVGSLLAVAILGAAAAERATRTESVALGDATSATVTVEMGAGRLRIASGSIATAGTPIPVGDLLRGDFTYDDARLAPTIDYRVDGDAGRLLLGQRTDDAGDWPWDERVNEWSLFLNPEVPTALRVEVGAGETTMALGGLQLTDLDIATGAAETPLDLTGDWRDGLSVRIVGGAGDLVVRLPEEVGVRVAATLGAGELDTDDLERDGDAFVNDAYGESPVTLTIEIKHGAGDVKLDVAE